jgi:hypothetical protein
MPFYVGRLSPVSFKFYRRRSVSIFNSEAVTCLLMFDAKMIHVCFYPSYLRSVSSTNMILRRDARVSGVNVWDTGRHWIMSGASFSLNL